MSETPQPTYTYFLWSKEKRIVIEKINDKVELLINNKRYSEKENEKEKEFSEDELINIAREKAREHYSNALKNFHFSNLVILSGAGSSVGIGSSNGEKGGQTMTSLWEELGNNNKILDFKAFIKNSDYDLRDSDGEVIRDLEKLLDHAHRNKVKDPSLEKDIKVIRVCLKI